MKDTYKMYKGKASNHMAPRLAEPKNSTEAMLAVCKMITSQGGVPDMQETLEGTIVVTCEAFPTFKATFKKEGL